MKALTIEQVHKLQKFALGQLIIKAGTKSRLSRLLDVSPQTVNGWFNRGRICKKKALIAQELFDGVFAYQLRPDFYKKED